MITRQNWWQDKPYPMMVFLSQSIWGLCLLSHGCPRTSRVLGASKMYSWISPLWLQEKMRFPWSVQWLIFGKRVQSWAETWRGSGKSSRQYFSHNLMNRYRLRMAYLVVPLYMHINVTRIYCMCCITGYRITWLFLLWQLGIALQP